LLGNFVRPLRERIDGNCGEPPKKETTMKTTKKISGIKVTASVKAGGYGPNHTRATLRVRTGLKAGGYGPNHTRATLRVRTGLKAGGQLLQNHSRGTLRVKTGLKAGRQLLPNHSATMLAVS
jgi:hypothetical protein